MKASIYRRYGSPEVVRIEEVPMPVAGKGEVLVRVVATTVSSADWRVRSLELPKGFGPMGRLMFGIAGPRKQVLGTEFSGIVEGAGGGGFQPGDAVIGFPGGALGAHAEYVAIKPDRLVAKPDGMDFAQAAAVCFGGTTAYDFLVNKAGLSAGQRVLINGASGAVGLAAVQLARHLGAEVTGVCSARNADLARDLGAVEVIDYAAEDVRARVAAFDMVVDTVGNLSVADASAMLVRGGKVVKIAGGLVDLVFGAVIARLKGRRAVTGVASEAQAVIQKVVDLAASGAVMPVIGRRYGFADMVAAHAQVDSGRKLGSVVVDISQP